MALEIQGLRPETKETLWTFFPKHHVPFSLVKPSATGCVPGNQRHKAFDDSSRSVSFKERRSSSVVRSCGHGCFAEHGWGCLSPEHRNHATLGNILSRATTWKTRVAYLTHNGSGQILRARIHSQLRLPVLRPTSYQCVYMNSWTPQKVTKWILDVRSSD